MNKKIKIVFVLPEITAGGAERVMSFVASNISKSDFDVTLWVAGYEKNTIYDVKNIKVLYFNKPKISKAVFVFFKALRTYKPDVVISSMSHVNTTMGLLSLFYPKTKFIGREANVLSIKKTFGSNKKSLLRKIPLTKISYKFLDLILCQSKDMFNDMKLNYDIPEQKMRIINNPITDNFTLKSNKQRNNSIVNFITVGRLKKQKGHERIIRALAKLDFQFKYTIVGDGPEKENLFKLIEVLGLEKNIEHIPYTSEVQKYLSKSDFFIQGAFVEGFPNCLIESCAVGTPILAYRAPGGLDEIIEPKINGLIAENDEEFVENLIKAQTKYDWHAEVINNSVTKKFNKNKILKKYEDLFKEISVQ